MAFLNIPNVIIKGLSACVPRHIDENKNYPFLNIEDISRLIPVTGIERKRVSDIGVCTSDLCYKAAERLISDLNWNKCEIDCLIFASPAPDYKSPATSCILQHRLSLSKDCYTLDITHGCSGWVYGLSLIASLMSVGGFRKGILLAGDTATKICAREDKTTWLLFGDAGTATALEFNQGEGEMKFHLGTDGTGHKAIIVYDGGARNPVTEVSMKKVPNSEGVLKSRMQLEIDGMEVFSFSMAEAPKSVNALLERYIIDKDDIDCFVFHQANFFMNEKIRKKLKILPEKVPYSLKNFGNTSAASIPLTLVTERGHDLRERRMTILGCGFGIGFSWGSVYFATNCIVCPELIEY